jgi:hypothetical protein
MVSQRDRGRCLIQYWKRRWHTLVGVAVVETINRNLLCCSLSFSRLAAEAAAAAAAVQARTAWSAAPDLKC